MPSLARAPPQPIQNDWTEVRAPEKIAEGVPPPPPVTKDLAGNVVKAEYSPMRTDEPVVIDGKLDEQIWETAPRDSHFFSRVSNPYGNPTTEPTAVQVAYDERALYVAFRCGYSDSTPPESRDHALPENELRAGQYSEAVSVQIDPRSDGSNAYSFQITRTGYQVDVRMSNNGERLNWEYRGLWTAAAHVTDTEWTAEFELPWSTLGRTPTDEHFDLRANFRRKVPSKESSAWSLMPPAFLYYTPVSYFGRLLGFEKVTGGGSLYLAPYVTFRHTGQYIPVQPLRAFASLDPIAHLYGGLLVRWRPSDAFQLDAVFNPDFSTAPPDSALVQLDRFELQYPEVRDFFATDRNLFEVGNDKYELFYSRRLGQQKTWLPITRGEREETPIFGAARAVVRAGGFEMGTMDVLVPQYSSGRLNQLTLKNFDENVTITRANYLFGRRTHIGVLLINNAIPSAASAMNMMAVDGEVSFLDEHFFASAFAARTQTAGARTGLLGSAKLEFTSQQFQANASYTQVDRAFDSSLSFVEQLGVRDANIEGAYLPQINSDFLRNAKLAVTVTNRTQMNGDAVYQRVQALMRGDLMDWGEVDFTYRHSADTVTDTVFGPTTLAGGRYEVAAGNYTTDVAELRLRTAPQKLIEAEAGYSEGGYFGGYRRTPSLTLRLNSPVLVKAVYELYLIQSPHLSLTAHRISGLIRYAPIPSFQTALIVEVNTFDLYSRAQASATYRFGLLSSIALVAGMTNFVSSPTGRVQYDAGVTFTYGIAAL